MAGYIIYHPQRESSVFNNIRIFHANTIEHQDPYIWNDRFLHSYCHITQMIPEKGHTNFWVSGDTFPNFNNLFCDIVFHVVEKIYWQFANNIRQNDAIIDSYEAFNDHYRWAMQHPFKKKRRFTLKADLKQSFQPLNHNFNLIDIVPKLRECGLSVTQLRKGLRRKTFGSQPMYIDDETVDNLFKYLSSSSFIQLYGNSLKIIRLNNQCLASP